MGEKPVGRLLLTFSLPALVAMVVNATYNLVDTAFVGRLGHEAIAALTLVWPVQLVEMSLALGVGIGANSLIARELGAGNPQEANHAGAQAALLGFVSGAVMMVLTLTFTDPLLRLLGAGPETLPLARDYLRMLMWFAPVVFLPMVANNLIRAEGNPNLSMAIMVVSALVNVVLDPLMIFGIGPFPRMGVAGAALATVVARLVGVVLYVMYFLSRQSGYRFRPRHFVPWPRVWARIYVVGGPSTIFTLAGSVVTAIANNVAAGFGSMALAAYGVVFRLSAFGFMPCNGISQGVLPLAAYNYGAKKLARVREVVGKGALAAAAITSVLALAFIAFPRPFVGLFSREPGFVALAAEGLRISAYAFAPVGALVVFSAFFQGIGRALPAMFLSLTRQMIFYLPALLVLSRLVGLTGFWVAIPVADGLSTIASVIWTTAAFRRLGVPLFRRGYSRP